MPMEGILNFQSISIGEFELLVSVLHTCIIVSIDIILLCYDQDNFMWT